MHELSIPAPVSPPQSIEGSSRPMLERMLDVVDYGMLLLLPTGCVGFANRVARNDLQDHPLLRLQGPRLQVRQARDAAALRDALIAAIHKGCQKLLTLGGEELPTLSVAIVPAVEPGATAASGALLLLGKRKVCDDLSVDAFARQHALTAAEQRVLRLLCAGRRPAEVACSAGVALSTVRTQVASILEKTGLGGIDALLREIARLPPLPSLLRAA